MSVVTLLKHKSSVSPVLESVNKACDSIAPSWPLDQLIAVNPYWQQSHHPFREVSAKYAALAGIQSIKPHAHWLELFQQGEITEKALRTVIARHGLGLSSGQCIAALEEPGQRPAQFQSLKALADQHRDDANMHWQEEVLYQTSQFCAAYYQQDPPIERLEATDSADALYGSWRLAMMRDSGISIVMATPGLKEIIKSLPESSDALFELATSALEVEPHAAEDYFLSLLLGINGWASYIAYRNWHAPSNEMRGLLSIALAWEWIIWEYTRQYLPDTSAQMGLRWQTELMQVSDRIQQHYEYERPLWIFFEAYEHHQQQRMQSLLLHTKAPSAAVDKEVQALFCIDVRSEVIRRALEAQSPAIETFGYAGFFGMPIQYQPAHTDFLRPQLPGLVTSNITASERDVLADRLIPAKRQAAWAAWSQSPIGAFSMVESAGWWYAFSMLKKMWLPAPSQQPADSLSHHQEWILQEGAVELDLQRYTELAAGALRTMGVKHFAATVLLIGHTSESSNNLHEAGLNCGACGGQSGEVNVRLLAYLLNRQDIREQLNAQGFNIPANTRFIPGLHNTTTDHISCFDGNLPKKLTHWLVSARAVAQSERARYFPGGMEQESDKQRNRLFRKRAKDWSQVQPEWGLAGNRALIIAPRAWSRGIDLEGRCFLHDYVAPEDPDGKILEQLMTAPMIVTNWINMQYNASVTDMEKLGSGNKVLHNAVAGNIGVFEGNSGDLRIGLSRQSLHDGEQWMHRPERLSVYIGAPRHRIAEVVSKHSILRNLVDNDWLYLFSWNRKGTIERLYQGSWYQSAGLSM